MADSKRTKARTRVTEEGGLSGVALGYCLEKQLIPATLKNRARLPESCECRGGSGSDCGRTTSTTFQELAERIQDYVRDRVPAWGRSNG